jgi:ACS family hexuronate transporter-like MFS transporter
LGATLFPLVVGAVLDHFKMLGHINAGYNVLFVVCGSAYLVAWVVMRVIRSSSKTVDIAQLAPSAHG